MPQRIILWASVGLALCRTNIGRADITLPELPPAKKAVKFTIVLDPAATGPRVQMPYQLAGALQIRRAPGPRGELRHDRGDRIAGNLTRPPNRLVFAGTALALFLASGGLWLLRRNGRRSMHGFGLLVAAGASLAVAAAAWADIPPPRYFRYRTPQEAQFPDKPIALEGKADISFFNGAEPVRVILDKKNYEKLKSGKLKMLAK